MKKELVEDSGEEKEQEFAPYKDFSISEFGGSPEYDEEDFDYGERDCSTQELCDVSTIPILLISNVEGQVTFFAESGVQLIKDSAITSRHLRAWVPDWSDADWVRIAYRVIIRNRVEEEVPDWDRIIYSLLATLRGKRVSPQIRKGGLWVEPNGTLVVNDGSRLRIDKIVYDEKGDFHYDPSFVDYMEQELGSRSFYSGCQQLPYFNEETLEIEDRQKTVKAILETTTLDYEIQKDCLLGWLWAASIGGGLEYRPTLYISGETDSGKSFTVETIINPLLLHPLGCVGGDGAASTESGFMTPLRGFALVRLTDEMDTVNIKGAEKKANFKNMIRGISSNSGSGQSHGSPHGGPGVTYEMRSTFCFLSINAGVVEEADRNRTTIISGTSTAAWPRDDIEAFEEASERNFRHLKDLDYGKAFVATTLLLYREFVICVKVMKKALLKLDIPESRNRKHYATLMTGRYLWEHDTAPNLEEALAFLESRIDGIRDLLPGVSHNSKENVKANFLTRQGITVVEPTGHTGRTNEGQKHSLAWCIMILKKQFDGKNEELSKKNLGYVEDALLRIGIRLRFKKPNSPLVSCIQFAANGYPEMDYLLPEELRKNRKEVFNSWDGHTPKYKKSTASEVSRAIEKKEDKRTNKIRRNGIFLDGSTSDYFEFNLSSLYDEEAVRKDSEE